MEKKKIDQRVRLTQHLLKNALVQLMQEQHISKISIRAICEFAGINRSTFYVHYTDQYDLLNKVEQEAMDNLKKYLIFFKKPDESFKNNWVYSYLKRDFHYTGILTLLCSFIENSKTSLHGILNIGKSFFYRLTLGVAAR